MTPNRQSSLLVSVPEVESLLADWRLLHDPAVALNIQCHITILYPFVPADLVDDTLVDRLRTLVSGFGAFEFELTGVSEFPGVLWLRPEPSDELVRLMQLMRSTFPDYLPYDGEFLDSVPHLTVAKTANPEQHDELRREIDNALAPDLPVRCSASALGLYTSDEAGTWTLHTGLPLGD